MSNYIIKYHNEDFLVEEISLIPQKNNGDFSLFELEKSNITTFSALSEIKKRFACSDIGYCGLKDEYAITKQIISIKTHELPIDFLKIYVNSGYIKLKKIDDGFNEHLKTGNLLGNKFKITLRNISASTMEDFKKVYPKHKIHINFINYYDEQRFGLPNDIANTHIIGKHLLDNDYKAAFNEIFLSKSEYKRQLMNEIHRDNSYKDAINSLPNNIVTFYLNSYMSFVWNKKATERIESFVRQNGLETYTHNTDTFSYTFLKSNSIPFIADTYANLLDYEYYLNKNETKTTSRKLINSTIVFISNISEDEFFSDKYKIDINFMLDSGIYATMLIKQLMGVLK